MTISSSLLRHIEYFCTGTPGTPSFNVYLSRNINGMISYISPWYDLPMKYNHDENLYVYVNEIPKNTRSKYEICIDSPPYHPIRQDIDKHGDLRYLSRPIPFNYGAMPQTWEDPNHIFDETGLIGDGDPLDVVELSDAPRSVGEVSIVRIVGALALIDEGETDWKLIALPTNDSSSTSLAINESTLDIVREWFRTYKGHPYNTFALNEEMIDAESVITTAHTSFLKKRQKTSS